MFKLMKYEMRKTLFMKLALIAVTAIVEVIFLTGYYKNLPTRQGVSLFIMALVALFGILFMGIQSIVTLHRDMNTRQSYMLFMTPNSTYGILGAKVLENTLTTLISGALYVGLIFFDIRLLISKNGEITDVIDMLKGFLGSVSMNFEFTFAGVAGFAALMLCSWVATVTTGYLADVIASSLLKGKKGGGLISVILFLVLTYAISEFVGILPGNANANINDCIQSAYNLVIAALCYVGTAVVMDKFLSV